QATVFSSAFHLCKSVARISHARSRFHPSIRLHFTRSPLWHQQRVRFHHLAIRSDAGRIFSGTGSVDRGHRRVGKSLAISLGTGGGPDFDRAPLVFVGTWHVRGDALASCLSIAPSKRRRDFDGSCFCFASCGNIDRSSGRWVDGAYGRPREQKVARLAGIRREISAAMASAFGLPVISPRRSPAADSRSPCSRRLPRSILYPT